MAVKQSRPPAATLTRMIYTGDNLNLLRGLNTGLADLIYFGPAVQLEPATTPSRPKRDRLALRRASGANIKFPRKVDMHGVSRVSVAAAGGHRR